MIPANKSALLDSILRFYFTGLVRKAFHTIAIRGLDHLENLSPDAPVLILSNHTNWWDGLLAYVLQPQMKGKDGYLMMEEKQLSQYRFFTRMGAFSVDRSHPGKSFSTIRYTLKLLRQKEKLVWIFPQGKICRPEESIHILPGTGFIAGKVTDLQMIPVAFRYEFFRENRPNVLIEMGPAFAGKSATEEKIQDELEKVYRRVHQAATEQNLSGFTLLFPPPLSINKKWEWVLRACQGRLREFHPDN